MRKKTSNSQPSAERSGRGRYTWAWARKTITFDAGQRRILKNQGWFPEQVAELEKALHLIRERMIPPIPIACVRGELLQLKKVLTRLEKKFLEMPKSSAGREGQGEALARLYQAAVQKAVDPHEVVTLENLITAANVLVDCAIAGLPKSRGKRQRSSPLLNGSGELITPIVRALHTGHAAHYRGLASVPKFDIRIARNNTRFLDIVGIVSSASGDWSVDEAIKAYRYNMKKIAEEDALDVTSALAGEKPLKNRTHPPKTLNKNAP